MYMYMISLSPANFVLQIMFVEKYFTNAVKVIISSSTRDKKINDKFFAKRAGGEKSYIYSIMKKHYTLRLRDGVPPMHGQSSHE